MSCQTPIKVGIIGTGIFAYRHLKAYRALGQDKFQIVACCNRSKEKAVKFAKEAGIPESAVYTDPQQLINDPNVELVDTLLPVQYNLGIVEAAISAHKHIIFEKPIAHNIEDARKIVLAARKADTVVAVAENWGFHPLVVAVGKFVQDGNIGEIINFTYDSVRSYKPDSAYLSTSWRQTPQHPGGYLSDGGVHDMAHLLPILGKFQSVSAFATQRYEVHGAEDTMAVAAKLENGAVGVINFTYCAAGVTRQTLAVHGTKGTIRLLNRDEVEFLDVSGNPVDSTIVTKGFDLDAFSDVEGEMANFHDVLRNGAKLALTPDDAFHHFAVIVAALESAKTESVAKVSKVDV
ncbi:hypothetical protein CLU79DRAFT_802665 [Phycomyces nitens]|nr:hypothetical protein CLU79DRAFT_802665 [Phycomyces nitens]